MYYDLKSLITVAILFTGILNITAVQAQNTPTHIAECTPLTATKGIPITLPQSELILVAGYVQAEWKLRYRIKKVAGGSILAEGEASGTSLQTIPAKLLSLKEDTPVKVEITAYKADNTKASDVTVLHAKQVLQANSTNYITQFVFSAEDHGGSRDDYDDLSLILLCYKFKE